MDNTSILKYNDENSLRCVICLAYYTAKAYYSIHHEFPSGKGFADLVFIPSKSYPDHPALIIELKNDKSAEGAMKQIVDQRYQNALKDYEGNIIMVGINYDLKTKDHTCTIEKIKL